MQMLRFVRSTLLILITLAVLWKAAGALAPDPLRTTLNGWERAATQRLGQFWEEWQPTWVSGVKE